MATHVCSNCGHQDPVFGSAGGDSLAKEYNAQVIADIPLSRQIRETSDAGLPIVLADTEGAVTGVYQKAAETLMKTLTDAQTPAAPTISMTD
jgi:ATP-binding protein involved in chromosome partitioning